MKRKLLSILLLIGVVLFVTACGKKLKLDDIVDKFNNSSTVTTYKEYGYEFVASATKDTLTITSSMGEEKSTLEFKLNGNILSNEKIANKDLMSALILVDSVGQAWGYKDGELGNNINSFSDDVKKYTVDKEGFEIVLGEETTSIKINLAKKIPLIDMDKFSLTTEDFDMIRQIVTDKENGNQSGKSGNIAYDVFVGDEESTITIGQEGKLGNSAYNSILAALEVMYGKDVANHFKEVYPNFINEKTTVEAFTIDPNYTIENQDESMFKDTKVVLVTISNKDL